MLTFRSTSAKAIPLAAAVVFALSVAAQADEEALVLSQYSDSVGNQEVYLTKSALKMINETGGVVLLAKAPAWQIDFFNTKTHVLFETPEANWRGALFGYPIAISERLADLSRRSEAGVDKVANLSAIHHVLDMDKPLHIFRGADYWILKESKYSVHQNTIMQKYYTVPLDSTGIPLKYTRWDNKAAKPVLTTTKSRSARVPDSFFEAPTGYGKVKSPNEILYNSSEKQDLIKDMLRDMK